MINRPLGPREGEEETFRAQALLFELERANARSNEAENQLDCARHSVAVLEEQGRKAQDRIAELEAALREVCQAVSWKEYGECRGWSDYLKTIPESLLQAKEALEGKPNDT